MRLWTQHGAHSGDTDDDALAPPLSACSVFAEAVAAAMSGRHAAEGMTAFEYVMSNGGAEFDPGSQQRQLAAGSSAAAAADGGAGIEAEAAAEADAEAAAAAR